jgi:hypothetical protein
MPPCSARGVFEVDTMDEAGQSDAPDSLAISIHLMIYLAI